ncbi:MAG: pyridoxal phosphate-dependent aminotransferase [Acutalibacteraceae bacterium]|nr:pyridoxal phosphate-dependent aminotransferase [Acutalibacteraceae bacterium]
MINRQMALLGNQPSKIREIFEYSLKRKAQIGADKVFDFSLGNPSIPAPKAVDDTIKDLVEHSDSVALHGYTSAQGAMPLRQKIAQNIKNRFGVEAEAQNIYITCGAAASLTSTLKAVVNDGDEVILLAPFFPEYQVFCENAGAKTVPVLCNTDDFSLDFDALDKAVNKNTTAIIVNSPNNPTGAVISKSDIEKLSALLKQKSAEYGREIYIIADEPYRELTYTAEVPYIPKFYDNTVVCYSYSKSLSLPGERIGYVFVSPKCADSKELFAAVCGAARSMGYVCAPSLMQNVIEKCEGETADISQYDKNRTLLYNSLTDIGYKAVKPEGAFYLFVKALQDDANEFCERAKKHELLLVPSDSFGIKGYVRISYCVAYDTIKNSIPAFKALYDEYNQG